MKTSLEEFTSLIREDEIHGGSCGSTITQYAAGKYGVFNEYERYDGQPPWYLVYCIRNEQGKLLFPPRSLDDDDGEVETHDGDGNPIIRATEKEINAMLPKGAVAFDCGYGWSCWSISCFNKELAIKVSLEFDYNRRPPEKEET